MNLNFKHLETFVWVADLGSFRRAASRLNTTQPNISSRIAALEAILGVTLMIRDAGSVRLTHRGQELLVHARQVLNAAEMFIEASGEKAMFEGMLRLGVTEMVAHTWIREFLKKFKEAYPNTQVELTVNFSAALEDELADRSIDIAFHSVPFTRRTTGNHDLGTYPFVWVASPALGLHHSNKVTAEDLARFPILTHARNTVSHSEVEHHFSSRPDLRAKLVPSSHMAACVQMAVDGLGVSAPLASMVKKELSDGSLIQLNYDWVPERLHFFARYDAQSSSSVVKKAAEFACEVSHKFQC